MIADLTNLQRLLYRAIAKRPGRVPGSDDATILSSIICGDLRLSTFERIRIYADAYLYRLLDCLKEDFPATQAVVGKVEFRELVRSYLTRYPPTEPSIFYAGRDFAQFLQGHPSRKRWPFLMELARLERALIEVFHGPDAEAISSDEMRSIKPAEWPELSIRTIPALKVMSCRWRVDDVLREAQGGMTPKQPTHAPVSLLIWRQRMHVYFRELQAFERAALEIISRGTNFSAVCEALASRLASEEPAAEIDRILTRWLADGLLVRL